MKHDKLVIAATVACVTLATGAAAAIVSPAVAFVIVLAGFLLAGTILAVRGDE